MKGVAYPDAEACIVLGEDLGDGVIGNEFTCMELSEYAFTEGVCESRYVDL